MKASEANELLLAMASAYVWVATSDEGVTSVEWAKYEHVMVESPFATQFNIEDIRIYFKDMVAAFQDDFEGAMAVAKEHIQKLKGQKNKCEEVLRICRAAVISDGKIKVAEENSLAEIAAIMGLHE